jgi:regulatory associated protein of mTOR
MLSPFARSSYPFHPADGIVRIYRNYDPTFASDDRTIELVSAFRALNDITSGKRGSGLVTDWHQATGNLFVGGDARVLRLWDAHRETSSIVRIVVLAP